MIYVTLLSMHSGLGTYSNINRLFVKLQNILVMISPEAYVLYHNINKSIFYHLTVYTLIYASLDGQGIIAGHDHNKNKCFL